MLRSSGARDGVRVRTEYAEDYAFRTEYARRHHAYRAEYARRHHAYRAEYAQDYAYRAEYAYRTEYPQGRSARGAGRAPVISASAC